MWPIHRLTYRVLRSQTGWESQLTAYYVIFLTHRNITLLYNLFLKFHSATAPIIQGLRDSRYVINDNLPRGCHCHLPPGQWCQRCLLGFFCPEKKKMSRKHFRYIKYFFPLIGINDTFCFQWSPVNIHWPSCSQPLRRAQRGRCSQGCTGLHKESWGWSGSP